MTEFFKKNSSIILKIFLVLGVLYVFRILYFSGRIVFFPDKGRNLKILDRRAQVLYEKPASIEGYKNYKEIDEVNPLFIKAILAIEDKKFYRHLGLDLPRIVKCGYSYIFKGEACGASTITQQYVKLKLGRKRRNIFHKFEEIIVSICLEVFLTKESILERYVNSVNFGNLRYGIESASHGYFGKDNMDLNLAQASFLAGIPNAPAKFDPYSHWGKAKERQKTILGILKQRENISENEYLDAMDFYINIHNNYGDIKAPHLVQMVEESRSKDKETVPETIKTTMDLSLYNEILEICQSKLQDISHLDASNSAVVVLDARSGQLLTMVGSANFFSREIEGEVNTAVAMRNPGSTMKPFVYALAFEDAFTPATQIHDKEQLITTFDEKLYFPRNYDRSEHGYVTVREALANSYNIPAVVTLKVIGLEPFFTLTDQIGIEEASRLNADIAGALGGFSVSLLDITNAYRIFPNEGIYSGKYSFILDDESETNQIGKFAEDGEQVFAQNGSEITYLVHSILSDAEARRREFGSITRMNLPFEAAVKTGTSTDFRDSWAIGYTKDFVVGVWVGNNDNSQMNGVNGITGAVEIWNEAMVKTRNYYSENFKSELTRFEVPENLEQREVCSSTGLAAYDYCDNYTYDELFIKNKIPGIDSNIKTRVEVLEPNLIEIRDPQDHDTFVYNDDLKIHVEYHVNSQYEEYRLLLNKNVVDKVGYEEGFVVPLPQGENILQVEAKNDDLIVKSPEIKVFVE